MLSYYQILQIEETASDAEVKQAYRKLVKMVHPDLNNDTPEATTIFKMLHEAYETLSDSARRKAYDSQPDSNGNDESRIEAYKKQNEKQAQRIKEYEKSLKEYKNTVYLKRENERKLIKEITALKEQNQEIERQFTQRTEEKLAESQVKKESDASTERSTNWPMLLLLIIGANIGLILLYLALNANIASSLKFF